MNKSCWSYLSRDVKMFKDYTESRYLDDYLDELGAEGWKLVSVDNGIAYFRRKYWKKVEE